MELSILDDLLSEIGKWCRGGPHCERKPVRESPAIRVHRTLVEYARCARVTTPRAYMVASTRSRALSHLPCFWATADKFTTFHSAHQLKHIGLAYLNRIVYFMGSVLCRLLIHRVPATHP